MSEKKVLLVKPSYQYFPVGFSYITAALERHGIAYDFLDGYLTENFELARRLGSGSYAAVATGGLLGNFSFYRNLFQEVKEVRPNMPCILGGNVTSDVDKTLLLTNIPVDFLVVGEGDVTFPHLVQDLMDGGGGIASIDGLYYRNGDEIAKTERRARLDLMERNYLPSWDFFDHKAYGDRTHSWPILTGRGCVGHCSFCSPTNGRFLPRTVEQIIEEIELLNRRYDPGMFNFINEIFFQDYESIHRFCEAYKKIEPRKIWHCLMRMDAEAEALLEMKEAGCRMMNVGVESASDQVLRNILKETTVSQMRRFITLAKEAGIILQGSFMMANYGEQEDELMATIDFMLEQGLNGPRNMSINYPGTANYRWAVKRGQIADPVAYLESIEKLFKLDYVQIISDCLAGDLSYLNLSAMPDEKLYAVIEREMRRFNTHTFAIDNAKAKIEDGRITLSGNCHSCGNELALEVGEDDWALSRLIVFCIRCGAEKNYFHPDILPGRKEINDENRRRIAGRQAHRPDGHASRDRISVVHRSVRHRLRQNRRRHRRRIRTRRKVPPDPPGIIR